MAIKFFIERLNRLTTQFNRYLRAISILFSNEIRHNKGKKLPLRIKALLHGTTSIPYSTYLQHSKAHYQNSISDFDFIYRLTFINEKYGILLADKLLAYQFFNNHENIFPKLYIVIRNGSFYQVDESLRLTPFDGNCLIETLKSSGTLIIKATLSYGGKGIHKVEYLKESNYFYLNGAQVEQETLVQEISSLKGEFIVTEFFVQRGYAHEIFSNSVNTIRILTLFESSNKEAWVAGAAHRFGSKDSGFLDNWTSGGISTDIDLETGELGKSAEMCINSSNPTKYIDHHPDTHVKIKGKKIAHWPEITAHILRLAKYAYKCPIIGGMSLYLMMVLKF